MTGRGKKDFAAKLSLPHLHETVPRSRLLDALRDVEERLIWVSGPPGAGKTCLLSDYVRRESIPHLWYQLDPGDEDPAVLFPWLTRAASALVSGPDRILPRFGAEFLPGLPTFTRRFFEVLCEALPKPAWLVFDDYHQIGEASPLHELIAAAAESIPAGVTLVVASRGEPPAALARLRLHRRMATLGWPELRLTVEEARAVAAQTPTPAAVDGIERLHALSDGWIAGLILLLHRGAEGKETDRLADQTALFAYFARELFDDLSTDDQRTLMLAAQTPSVSATQFRRATGGALDLRPVERLAAANLFVMHSGGSRKTCSFHPLFREFLLDRASTHLAGENLTEYRRRAAEALVEDGSLDEAIPLLFLLQDYERAAGLVCRQAPDAMRSGRLITLATWLRQIPDSFENPWIDFWRAQLKVMTDPAGARRDLDAAIQSFMAAGDAVGAYTAWGCAVESYMVCWGTFEGLPEWLSRFDQIQAWTPLPPDPTVEVRLINGLLLAAIWHRPDLSGIERWVGRMWELLDGGVDAATAVVAAQNLLMWHMMRGEMATARQLKDVALSRIRSDASVDIMALAVWKLFLSLYYRMNGQVEESYTELRACEDLAGHYGLDILRFQISALKVYVHITKDDVRAARRTVDSIRDGLNPNYPLEEGHWYMLAALVSLMEGHYVLAADQALRSAELGDRHEAFMPAQISRMVWSQCLFECGDVAAARKQVREGLRWCRRSGLVYLIHWYLLVDAYYHDRLGDSRRALRSLREAFRLGRKGQLTHGAGLMPMRVFQRNCALALRHGIEVDYARQLISDARLTPAETDRDLEAWPWPVRIYTLGRFSVLCDDAELKPGSKARRKPLEMLKILIALGGGKLRGEALADALWPDADADTAKRNFDTTLHRLRKLLAVDQAILMEGGKVGLNPDLCWVDAWALDAVLARVADALPGVPGGCAPDDRLAALQSDLITRYAGEFLAKEEIGLEGISRREHYRSATAGALLRLATCWRRRHLADRGREACEGALSVDPLLEDGYRELIRLALDEGRYAEAASHYERCVAILASELGVPPAAETTALLRPVRDKAKC